MAAYCKIWGIVENVVGGERIAVFRNNILSHALNKAIFVASVSENTVPN
jgi:hypothetical protein